MEEEVNKRGEERLFILESFSVTSQYVFRFMNNVGFDEAMRIANGG